MFSYNPSSSPGGKQWVSLATQCVGVGPDGMHPMLARVSLTDYRGATILDKYVRPTAPVVDYWPGFTGIGEEDLRGGDPYAEIRTQVAEIIRGRIIVGHRLWEDLSQLGLVHPTSQTRDVALYLPLRKRLGTERHMIIDLPRLVQEFMHRLIAVENQDALENARACMDLYRSCTDWELSIEQDKIWNCAVPPQEFVNCYT